MWNLKKNDTHELIYKTHRHRKQTYGYQSGKLGEGQIWCLGLKYTY